MPLRFSALLLALALTGCDGFSDFVDDPVGDFAVKIAVRDAEVPLGDGVTAAVTAGQPTLTRQTVAMDLDVQFVDEIQDLRIRPQDIRFTPDPARVAARGVSDATGTLSANVGAVLQATYYPLLAGTVTLEDGVVTDVDLEGFVFFEGQALQAVESALGAVDTSMSAEDAAAAIAEGWSSAMDPSMELVVGLSTTGTVTGSITLDQIQYDGVVTP